MIFCMSSESKTLGPDKILTKKDISVHMREVVIGEACYPPGGSLGPRRQSHYQFVYLRNGSCSVHLDDEVYKLKGPSVFLLIPGRKEQFYFDTQEITDHAWLHFFFEKNEDSSNASRYALPLAARLTKRMEALLALAMGLRDDPGPYSQVYLNLLGDCLWLDFISQFPDSSLALTIKHPAINRALAYIDAHWQHEGLKEKDIAHAACVTPRHLLRLFKQHFGQSPMRYVWHVRLQRALDLIASTGLPVSLIAEQTGFRSSAHFSRAVKEQTDLSPRQFRRDKWKSRRS